MRHYVVVYPNRDYGKLMWKDLENSKNIDIVREPLISGNMLTKWLFKVHFSFYINNKIRLPLKRIWFNKYNLSNLPYRKEDDYIIIMTDPALCNYSKEYMEKLKAKGNIKMVLLMINSLNRMKKVISPMLPLFDRIYTFDRREARKYKFYYYPTIYSTVDLRNTKKKNAIDCFFVGVAKDRLDKLVKIYDHLEAGHAQCVFYISGVKKHAQVKREGIVYNEWLSYQDVLDKVAESETILEVMDDNNAGVTLRTLEAICYNKKLITDNIKIKDNDFYSSQYMQLIDYHRLDGLTEFIHAGMEVNYHYDNRYSPKYFIAELDRCF